MPLAELISRYALELVLGAFAILLAVVALGIVLLRFAWSRRQFALSVINHLVRAGRRYPPFSWLAQRFPGGFTRFGQRLNSIEFLGIYLGAGLVITLGFIAFFGLAERVLRLSGLAQFDHELATALQTTLTPAKLSYLHLITNTGSGIFLTGVGVVIGVFLLLRRQWSVFIGWTLTLLGGGVMNGALKAAFQRVRPEYSTIGGWSFPSGHAMGSFIAYGMLAYLALVYLPRRAAVPIASLLLLLVMLIGFTRIYLGVHFFSDVIAGYSAGAIWLAVTVSGTEIARLTTRRREPGVEPAEPPVVS